MGRKNWINQIFEIIQQIERVIKSIRRCMHENYYVVVIMIELLGHNYKSVLDVEIISVRVDRQLTLNQRFWRCRWSIDVRNLKHILDEMGMTKIYTV